MSDLTVNDTDQTVLQNLAKMGAHLKELKQRMLRAEAMYEHAKKEHDYYATSVLPMEMFAAGVSELKLMDGGVMSYERKYYCQPNKNESDKQIMAQWLRQHGGENLVKEKASVDGAQISKLREAGIPYTEIDDINTNSLKAFLKDKIGASLSGTAQITIDQIPACMHFQEVGIVNIEL